MATNPAMISTGSAAVIGDSAAAVDAPPSTPEGFAKFASIVPAPGGLWKVAPDASDAGLASSGDGLHAFTVLAALLLVSAIPLAMTFSMRTKKIVGDILNMDVRDGAFAKLRDRVKPSLNPVRIGGEEIPDVKVDAPSSPESRFSGGRGIS